MGYITTLVLEAHLAALLFSLSGSLIVYLTFALMTLVFFRAAYRGSASPLWTV